MHQDFIIIMSCAMAGEAAVSIAPVSPTSTTKNVKTLNETTTAARENLVAPGVVTESVAQNEEETTGSRDGKDQGPFVSPSLLDHGRSSQTKLVPIESPDQMAIAAVSNSQTLVHCRESPTSGLPHATQTILQQGGTNAQSESTPKPKIVEKERWKSGFRRVWQGKRPSKKSRSPDIGDKNVKDDSKERSSLDDDDKEYVTGDYSKESSGLDDGDKQGMGGYKEDSKTRGMEDDNNPATGERRPLINYQNIEAIQQQQSRRPDTSDSYSDVPVTPPFMPTNYSPPPSFEMPTDN